MQVASLTCSNESTIVFNYCVGAFAVAFATDLALLAMNQPVFIMNRNLCEDINFFGLYQKKRIDSISKTGDEVHRAPNNSNIPWQCSKCYVNINFNFVS